MQKTSMRKQCDGAELGLGSTTSVPC